MEPIIGYTLAEIANSVALQLDPPHPPAIQLKDIPALYIILPNNDIIQIAHATPCQLESYISFCITSCYKFSRKEAYTRKRRDLLSSTLDIFAVWYALSEMLQDGCFLLLYRSYEDAVAKRDAVVKTRREQYVHPRRPAFVEVEGHVTVEQLQAIVEAHGFEFSVVSQPYVRYFAIRHRSKGVRYRKVYLASVKSILLLTEDKVVEMLKDEGI